MRQYSAVSVRQFVQPSLERPALQFLLRETHGSFVRGSGAGWEMSGADVRDEKQELTNNYGAAFD